MHTKPIIYIFIGPPGSGKGTLATRCNHALGIPVLATGNVCRQHISKGTPLGKELARITEKGELASDDLILEIVTDWLSAHVDGAAELIFDGFPRTQAQAQLFTSYLKKSKVSCIVKPIVFDVSHEVLLARLTRRTICTNNACQAPYSPAHAPQTEGICDYCGSVLAKRADDDHDVVLRRIAVYEQHAQKMIAVFDDQLERLNVDVMSIDQVYDAFLHIRAAVIEGVRG